MLRVWHRKPRNPHEYGAAEVLLGGKLLKMGLYTVPYELARQIAIHGYAVTHPRQHISNERFALSVRGVKIFLVLGTFTDYCPPASATPYHKSRLTFCSFSL